MSLYVWKCKTSFDKVVQEGCGYDIDSYHRKLIFISTIYSHKLLPHNALLLVTLIWNNFNCPHLGLFYIRKLCSVSKWAPLFHAWLDNVTMHVIMLQCFTALWHNDHVNCMCSFLSVKKILAINGTSSFKEKLMIFFYLCFSKSKRWDTFLFSSPLSLWALCVIPDNCWVTCHQIREDLHHKWDKIQHCLKLQNIDTHFHYCCCGILGNTKCSGVRWCCQ